MSIIARDIEVRTNDTGAPDEVIATNCTMHIEQMDSGHWWIGINLPDGTMWHVNFTARGRITARVEQQ